MSQPHLHLLVGTLFILGLSASLAVWLWAAARWRRGLAVIPYQPRRSVPWQGWEILLVVLSYLLIMDAASRVLHDRFPEKMKHAAAAVVEKSAGHAMTQLAASGRFGFFLLAAVSAVIVAPLVEELLFRVLLQGWLEAVVRRHRRDLRDAPGFRRLGPIVLIAAVFAAMHGRPADPKFTHDYLVALVTTGTVANLLVLAATLLLVRVHSRAKSVDFGWVPAKFAADVRLGLLAFVAVGPPVYLLMAGLEYVAPANVVVDPLPLFFFALGLGVLYARTHRLVPSLVLHMALNATSLLLAWMIG